MLGATFGSERREIDPHTGFFRFSAEVIRWRKEGVWVQAAALGKVSHTKAF